MAALMLLLVLVLLTTSVLKQREVPATVSSFNVSVVYTAIIRTSIAAVVLGCFYFCPLDCDASFMVVDCAAVETGYMLENTKCFFCVKLSIKNHIVRLVHKNHINRTCLMYHAACNVEFQSFQTVVLTAAVFQLSIKIGCTPAVLQQKGIYTYPVRIQNFLFHFPFDGIYRRLLSFTLGRSVSA